MIKVLKAWLRKNQLTPDQNNYTAQVSGSGSVGVEDIIDEMLKEGIELNRDTVLEVISRFNRTTADMVLSGNNVNTGLVYMRPIITGPFYDKTWNPEVNPVYVSITQGQDLRRAVAETTVEILDEQADPLETLSLTD